MRNIPLMQKITCNRPKYCPCLIAGTDGDGSYCALFDIQLQVDRPKGESFKVLKCTECTETQPKIVYIRAEQSDLEKQSEALNIIHETVDALMRSVNASKDIRAMNPFNKAYNEYRRGFLGERYVHNKLGEVKIVGVSESEYEKRQIFVYEVEKIHPDKDPLGQPYEKTWTVSWKDLIHNL